MHDHNRACYSYMQMIYMIKRRFSSLQPVWSIARWMLFTAVS